MSLKLVLLLCTLGLWLSPCHSGWISVRFVSFENPDGVGENGHCCDGKWGVCQIDGCDHVFLTCLNNDTNGSDGHSDSADCSYFRVIRGPVYNEDSFVFGNTIGNHQNPLVTSWEEYPESLQLKVEVNDDDGLSDNDYVSFLRLDINSTDIARTRVTGGHDFSVADEITRLTVNIRIWCDPGFYGERCEIPCERGELEACDPDTGAKYCLLGFTGEECERMEQ